MPGWYYSKKELRNTPSAADGIDYKTEMRYRREGARFIRETKIKMDLGYNTIATGVVYFHRFYMFHSFKQFPRYVTACCCLFLAGKVEETPKKCKDIIKMARTLLTDQKFATFGADPKEEVMTLERILLQTIKFDLQVEHPYSYLLKYAKCLRGDKTKLEKMVQMAWTFINDSLCTTLCLQWEPEIIAVALMYLAGKLTKFEVTDWSGKRPKHLRWWDMFVEDITMDLLEDICHQVLDLYSQPEMISSTEGPPSPILNKPPTPPPVTESAPSTSNGNEKTVSPEHPLPVNTKVPPPVSVPQFPYPTFTGAPPPVASFTPVFTAPMTTPPGPPDLTRPPPGPIAHINVPPPTVFPPPFVSHPPPFPPVVPPRAPPFYAANAPPPNQPQRPYYPPS